MVREKKSNFLKFIYLFFTIGAYFQALLGCGLGRGVCVYSEHNTSGQIERGRSSGPALGKAFGMSWGENGELQVVGSR